MKLDKDPFLANINMIEINGKVLVRPSQAKSTKGKEVVIGEERERDEYEQAKKSRNWLMEEEREKQATISSKSHLQHPHG
jgi:uncharacterized membrane protein YcaP (DUF421 family)